MEKKNWLQLAEGTGTDLIMGQAMNLLDGVLGGKVVKLVEETLEPAGEEQN